MQRDDNDTVSISFVQSTDDVCMKDGDGTPVYFSFHVEVRCNEAITEKGEAKIIQPGGVTMDPCQLSVRMEHDAGCPQADALGVIKFIGQYPWIIGII